MHHHAGQIEAFVRERNGFGVDVRFSREPEKPLDTGGGLWQARQHFRGTEPFYLHNGDILTDVPLEALRAAHTSARVLATLAVRPPSAERYLIFDEVGLVGFSPRGGGAERMIRAASGELQRWDFAGIHVIEPRIFRAIDERGEFSIVDVYLRLSQAGEVIRPFPFEGVWVDIGTPERLAEADRIALAMRR
jgi:NDP-sugar pyrophosphorylase family protein